MGSRNRDDEKNSSTREEREEEERQQRREKEWLRLEERDQSKKEKRTSEKKGNWGERRPTNGKTRWELEHEHKKERGTVRRKEPQEEKKKKEDDEEKEVRGFKLKISFSIFTLLSLRLYGFRSSCLRPAAPLVVRVSHQWANSSPIALLLSLSFSLEPLAFVVDRSLFLLSFSLFLRIPLTFDRRSGITRLPISSTVQAEVATITNQSTCSTLADRYDS